MKKGAADRTFAIPNCIDAFSVSGSAGDLSTADRAYGFFDRCRRLCASGYHRLITLLPLLVKWLLPPLDMGIQPHDEGQRTNRDQNPANDA